MTVTRRAVLAVLVAAPLAACAYHESATAPTPMPMTVLGRAGYAAGVLGPGSPQHFRSVFVGAFRKAPRSAFCVEVLGQSDGTFKLEIPPCCFAEGEAVHLTAGGLDTCVEPPFQAGTRVKVELLGRREACAQS